jgi:hypothetical protein
MNVDNVAQSDSENLKFHFLEFTDDEMWVAQKGKYFSKFPQQLKWETAHTGKDM